MDARPTAAEEAYDTGNRSKQHDRSRRPMRTLSAYWPIVQDGVLVGSKRALANAVRTVGAERRYTALAKRLSRQQ